MADALKAEGNKAFAAKDFEEAVYVSLVWDMNRQQLIAFVVKSSPQRLRSNPRTMFYIQIDLEPTLP